jgi:hypothetical protein
MPTEMRGDRRDAPRPARLIDRMRAARPMPHDHAFPVPSVHMKTVAVLSSLILAASCLRAQTLPPQPPPSIKGEVLETQSVDSYTYLRLKTGDGEVWAVPSTTVKKGAQVTIGNAMTMRDFESKTLKKRFDAIVFGQIVEPNATAMAPHGASIAAAARTPAAKVPRATGPDARTVAEVVAGKAALNTRTVLVRAQVVKVNLGIMGKNWLHLQDGSGSAADGTNDILVTTQDRAAVGDVVNARGKVRTDVNLGAGYAYAVLIEDATVRK